MKKLKPRDETEAEKDLFAAIRNASDSIYRLSNVAEAISRLARSQKESHNRNAIVSVSLQLDRDCRDIADAMGRLETSARNSIMKGER